MVIMAIGNYIVMQCDQFETLLLGAIVLTYFLELCINCTFSILYSSIYRSAPVTSRLKPTVILDCPTMGGNLNLSPHTCTHSHLVYTYLWVGSWTVRARPRTHVQPINVYEWSSIEPKHVCINIMATTVYM